MKYSTKATYLVTQFSPGNEFEYVAQDVANVVLRHKDTKQLITVNHSEVIEKPMPIEVRIDNLMNKWRTGQQFIRGLTKAQMLEAMKRDAAVHGLELEFKCIDV